MAMHQGRYHAGYHARRSEGLSRGPKSLRIDSMTNDWKADRSMIGKIAAHTNCATSEDRSARTAPAGRAFLARFEKEVDREGRLSQEERAKRAESPKEGLLSRAQPEVRPGSAREAEARQLMVTRDEAIQRAGEILAASDAAQAQMTPREQAEVAWTHTSTRSVDELEYLVRVERGMESYVTRSA